MRPHLAARALLTSPRNLFVLFACLFAASELHAQYGVSPSQTGVFFDELRARAEARRTGPGVRQGEGLYDFSQEGFELGPDGAPLGPLQEASRQVNQGVTSSGGISYSQRTAGDYTQYSGPYPATSSFFAPPYTSDPYLGGKRNLKLGPVNLGFGMTGAVEFNDNISRTKDKEEELIASLYTNVSANYPISETNTLAFSVAIGVDHYFLNPDLSPYGEDFVLSVLPGSTISFDGKIGPVFYVIYDRVSVRPATRNDYALDPTEIFGVFQNDLGLGAAWAINSALSLSVNYMHSNAIALEDEDSIYDRNTDSVQASLAWSPDGTWTAGLEGTYTWVMYPEDYNNDGKLASGGAFFGMPVGNSTYFRVGGGIQSFDFEEPPEFNQSFSRSKYVSAQNRLASATERAAELSAKRVLTTSEAAELTRLTSDGGTIDDLTQEVTAQTTAFAQDTGRFNSNTRDSSDLDDFYYNVTLSNRLSSRVSHALAFGHESALNSTSNFITADYVSYGIGIIAWRGSRIAISGYYESSEESGGMQQDSVLDDNGNATFTAINEDIDQYGFDVYLNHQFTPRLRGGIGYHFGLVDSNRAERDYRQDAINLDFSYVVNKKLTLSMGYRFLTTNADDDEFDFDQNRIIMTANYNF